MRTWMTNEAVFEWITLDDHEVGAMDLDGSKDARVMNKPTA